MHARTADVDRMLLAVLGSAPSLNAAFPLAAWLATKSLPDCRHHYSGGVHDPPASCSATAHVR
jgi:hypothetical protein